MVVGFNHNFRYNGELYHVQTEDGGVKNPFIVTLLYKAGTILARKKVSYNDILKADNLPAVVEELMKDQHREMLRCLKNGEFDAVIEKRTSTAGSSAAAETVSGPPAPVAAQVPPTPAAPPEPLRSETVAPDVEVKPQKSRRPMQNLDDIILSYLVGEDS